MVVHGSVVRVADLWCRCACAGGGRQFEDQGQDHRLGVVNALQHLSQLTQLTINTRSPAHCPFSFSDIGVMFMVRGWVCVYA